MRLGNIKSYNMNFKGYDARPLKAVALTSPGYRCEIARELEKISQVGDFKVEILTENKLKDLTYIDELVPTPEDIKKKHEELYRKYNGLVNKDGIKIKVAPYTDTPHPRGFRQSKGTCTWAQDINVVTPHGYIVGNPCQMTLANNIAKAHNLKPKMDYEWLPGGNIFYIKNQKGEDELLVGKISRKKLRNDDNNDIDYERLKKVYGVKKVTFLPQLDFHLDLFIRPLDNKRILIADDKLTLSILQDGKIKLAKAIKETTDPKKAEYYDKILEKLEDLDGQFLCTVLTSKFSKIKKTEEILNANGFETIHVPGRIYGTKYSNIPIHSLNFMNGIAVVNKKNELVYITNKSKLDIELGITSNIEKEIGFSLEKAFKDSVAPYIKPQNIFFVSGLYNEIADNLSKKRGGIHCMVTEIPE